MGGSAPMNQVLSDEGIESPDTGRRGHGPPRNPQHQRWLLGRLQYDLRNGQVVAH